MYLPRWVVISIYSVYKAVMVMFSPNRMIEKLDHENTDMVTNSSPIRLMDGGKARFIRLAKNHQAAISGKIICNPRARIIVRLCVRS